jgi:Na+/melibiose symporter-like transporter
MFLFLAYYFQITLGYSALKSGVALLPFSGGIIISAGVVAQLLPRVGPKPLMLGGLAIAVVGMFLLTRVSIQSDYVGQVLPSEILISLGMAGVFIPASSTALVGVGSRDAGVASALLNTTQQIGGSLGTALLNTIYASVVSGYIVDNLRPGVDPRAVQGQALLVGYHHAFFWGAVLLAVALVVAIVFINAKKDDIPAEPALAAA